MNDGESFRVTWWRTLLAYVLGLVVFIGLLVVGLLIGNLVDSVLSASIGATQSKITAYVAAGTWLLCLWDRHRQRRQRATDRGDESS